MLHQKLSVLAGPLLLLLSSQAAALPPSRPLYPRQDGSSSLGGPNGTAPPGGDIGGGPVGGGERLITFADAFSGNFTVRRTNLVWTSQGSDGTYVEQDGATGDLRLANVVGGNSTTFVRASDVEGVGADYYDYWIQGSGEHVLFATNYTQQYRHSYFADYFIHNVADRTTVPLVNDQVGDIQYAEWSPEGNTIAFVRGNNLFVWQDGTTTQITDDGGPDLFYGVPDWVYEEEIFGDRYALWFSPDGERLAFLRTDETGVGTFTVPYYMADGNVAPPYPQDLDIRYPKVGTTNPTISFQLLDMTNLAGGYSEVSDSSFPPEEKIIGEVAWVTDDHSRVLFRAYNRVQDQERIVLVDVESGSGSVVRERSEETGWLDNNLAIQYIPGSDSYLDLSDMSGWNHLYVFPVDGGEPLALTSGEWEVTAILSVDTERNVVYYASTERDSTERHVYSVGLDGENKRALVDDSEPGYWTASFSSGSGYYILSYNGPGLPNQRLFSANSTSTPIRTINDNSALRQRLSEYNLPNVTWTTMEHPDGYSLNVMQRLPPNFDPSRQYPVLFDIYGGPGSQQAGKTFRQVDFRSYVASDPELEYIILSVDNRGTGLRGREYRALVTRQLGLLEAQDQVWAAQQYAQNSFVDASKITIWGWSYGGYLTAKVLETDSDAFSMGIITAPVSDWRFYDSMYTERYMKTPDTNGAGYNESAVHDATGFENVRGGFILQHGTGDDNVHFQNSAVLVDTLTVAQVSPAKMHVQWFTDSDHSINFHGSNRLVYRQMAHYLFLEKERVEGEEEGEHQYDAMFETAEEPPAGRNAKRSIEERDPRWEIFDSPLRM